MSYLLSVLPALACVVLMFGAGALIWLAARTPLRRVGWIERRVSNAR